MKARSAWSRVLIIIGSIAMLAGAVDPLEGSVVILAGSGLVALGTYFSQGGHRLRSYWLSVFISIAVGVAVMFVLSALGGIGGTTGRSMWWGLLVLPYPVGWVMGIGALVFRLVNVARHRHATA